MAKRLFVGKLPYEATSTQLEELFSQAGKVESVNVITDRMTGQGKGFAFVEMVTEEDAKRAIETLNGAMMNGRSIVVSEARPQENRGGGSRGGFGGREGGGFGRGDRRGGDRGGYSRGKRW